MKVIEMKEKIARMLLLTQILSAFCVTAGAFESHEDADANMYSYEVVASEATQSSNNADSTNDTDAMDDVGANEDGNAESDVSESEHANGTMTVRFFAGGTLLETVEVQHGQHVTQIPSADNEENEIYYWLDANGNFVIPTEQTITEAMDFYAYFAPALNSNEHITYVSGDGAGSFLPNQSITRAQAAKMLYSLLESQELGSYSYAFSDVNSAEWYYTPVSVLASLNVLTGTDGGAFYPNKAMTRAEFVTMLSRFYPLSSASTTFADVPQTSWAQTYIASAVAKGWVNGYEDGTFRPNNALSRAEAVVIINRVLGRQADTAVLEKESPRIFADLTPDHWAYANVLEAVVPHTVASGDSETESWQEYQIPTSGLTAGIHTIGGSLYLVNAATLQFDTFEQGFQTIDGKLYYSPYAGQALAIYRGGPIELEGALYCSEWDGSFRTNGNYGYLYFGEDGKYTSGNAELDALVETELAKCVNASMTPEEKLRAIFNHVRDSFSYLGREHQARGATGWEESYALSMLQTRKGNCYSWASTFLYMVRRTGYDAYAISGGVGTNNRDHAWVMINMDDSTYMFDTELAWSYNNSINFYKMTRSSVPFPYIFPS